MKLYPMTFVPILKDRIWGGTKLESELGKKITSPTTGESWELSAVPGDISLVANGEFQGRKFDGLIAEFPEELLGKKVVGRFGAQLPLLFKFIDAKEDLSIQVHPDDALAKARHGSFGKTEMWYIMQADPGSRLIVGFRKESSAEEYLQHLKSNSLPDILQSESVKEGDVFFLETGTIHAIGAGVMLAEIQQTSDITYRIYDWNRVDASGNPRQLHVEEALEAMNYKKIDAARDYEKVSNDANLVVDCPFFTTDFIPLDGKLHVNRTTDSFYVYMCVDGEFSVETRGERYTFKKGDTVFVPAVLNEYDLTGKGKLLQVYIK